MTIAALHNPCQSQTTTWTNLAGGNFSSAGNWSAGVPTGSSIAQFSNVGTYTILLDADSSFGTFTIANAGVNVAFQANATPRFMNLTGNFNVSNGAVASFNVPATTITAANLQLAGGGSSLTLNGGTLLSATATNLGSVIGNSSFILDGVGTQYTGTGNLHRVGIANGSTSVMTIRNNAVAYLDNDPGSLLRIGGSNSNTSGTVNVQSGASLHAGNISIGQPSGSFLNTVGTLNLSGSGSQINQVGISTLTLGGSAAGNQGFLNISGGTLTTGTGTFTINSAGQVSMSAGTLNTNGNVTIGGLVDQTGGQFNLASGRIMNISGGGAFVTAASVTNTFNNTTVSILGAGSRYTSQTPNSSTVIFDGGHVNVTSSGELSIGTITLGATTASTLNANSGAVVAGVNLNLLNGSIATLANTTGLFTNTMVDGSLGITSSSSYSSTNMVIGNLANSQVNVTNSSVSFAANSGTALTMGKSSGPTGILALSNSSFATAPGGTNLVNATGQINATNSTFNLRGLLDLNGGAFNQTGGSFIGGTSQSITVRNGGTFVTSNPITLSPLTSMAVTVNGGTSSFQSQSLNLNSLSSLTLNGGTATSNFFFEGGTVNFNSGTLRHTGSLVMDAVTNNLLFGASSSLGIARRMIVDGTATIESPLALGGGRLTVGNINGGSLLNLNQGTFQLTGSTLTIGGGQFGDVLAINSGLTVETTMRSKRL